jgi:DnaK suppressor protein
MPAKKTTGARKVVKKTATKTVKKAVKKAVKKTVKKVAKTAVKKVAAKKTVKKAVAKKAVKAAVKKTVAKKAVKKTVAKKAVKKTVKKVVKKTVSATAKKVAKVKDTQKKGTPMAKAEEKVKKPAKKAPAKKVAKQQNAAAGPLGFTPYEAGKDEEYMNEAQQAHFKNILNLWKQQLMEEVDLTVGHMKEGDNYADLVDRASMEADFNLELRTRDRERKLIRKIEQAMDSIDTGDYGFCEDCGADIGVRRLEARPTATKCIDCKTFQEIREKQGA